MMAGLGDARHGAMRAVNYRSAGGPANSMNVREDTSDGDRDRSHQEDREGRRCGIAILVSLRRMVPRQRCQSDRHEPRESVGLYNSGYAGTPSGLSGRLAGANLSSALVPVPESLH